MVRGHEGRKECCVVVISRDFIGNFFTTTMTKTVIAINKQVKGSNGYRGTRVISTYSDQSIGIRSGVYQSGLYDDYPQV
jgi:hypothetical protein